MPKIEVIYAFIAEEGPNDEGVVAAKIGGVWMPLVCADMERVESVEPLAKRIAQATKQKITLAKFEKRTDLREIK